MKRFISILLLLFCVWIVELKDGSVYEAKEARAGRKGVTLVWTEGTQKVEKTFSWWQIKTVTYRED